MKLNFKTTIRPPLKPGQIWERKGTFYLAVRAYGNDISLVSLPSCSTTWDGNNGFSGDDDEFTFVDILEMD